MASRQIFRNRSIFIRQGSIIAVWGLLTYSVTKHQAGKYKTLECRGKTLTREECGESVSVCQHAMSTIRQAEITRNYVNKRYTYSAKSRRCNFLGKDPEL